MADLVPFLESNWINLVQSTGIVASLLFAAVTIRREARTHKMTTLLALDQQHRELWSELHQRPELARILSLEVDLVGQPVTIAETEFLNTVFVHYCTGWRLAAEHGVFSEDDLRRDIADFLARPIPLQVWRQTSGTREQRFVAFVERVRVQVTPFKKIL